MQHLPQVLLLNGHEGVQLEWNRSLAGDFSHYEIQWSTTPGTGYTWLANTTEPRYIVPVLERGRYHYFIIYAWDIHNNRSAPSEEIQIYLA